MRAFVGFSKNIVKIEFDREKRPVIRARHELRFQLESLYET